MPDMPRRSRPPGRVECSRTSDWSSGMLSSTRPLGVCILPFTLQLRSGYLRGTGPVSHAPGKDLNPFGVLNDLPPCGFVLLAERDHPVVLALGEGTAIENPLAHVHHGQEPAGSFFIISRRRVSRPPVWSP